MRSSISLVGMILSKVPIDLSKCNKELQGLTFFQLKLLEKFCMTQMRKEYVLHPTVAVKNE